MKVILSTLIVLTLLTSSWSHSSLSAKDTQYQHDSYDRIYKENGVWYGIININDSHLSGWNCAYGKCHGNAIYLNFTRNTKSLEKITYEYTTLSQCHGINLYLICLGDNTPSEDGQETIYEKSKDGSFLDYILDTSSITKAPSIVDDIAYDYRIISESDKPFKEIEIIDFIYTLTDSEVDDVLTTIQNQYDDDLNGILIDQKTSYEEKEKLFRDLKTQYSDYTIQYGESLKSLCENEELCIIENTDVGQTPVIGDLKTLITGTIIIVISFIVGFTLLKEIAEEVFQMITSLLFMTGQTISQSIYRYIAYPILYSIKFIVTSLFRLVFWWI